MQLSTAKSEDLEAVERAVQLTLDAAWEHGLAECQVRGFFPWSDSAFQTHCPHGITTSILDLKNLSDNHLKEILTQLATFKIRYHFMAYKKLAIASPADLVINLHIVLLPLDVHLPIGPKQGAFSIHVERLPNGERDSSTDEQQFQVKFGKIGAFQYAPAQILWHDIHPSICSETSILP